MNFPLAGTNLVLSATIFILLIVSTYLFEAYAYYTIAKKLGETNPWLAFVPIANIYLLVKLAGKPTWWLFLLLVPGVNIVIIYVIHYFLITRLGKSGWLFLLLFINPFGHIFLSWYLAFGDKPRWWLWPTVFSGIWVVVMIVWITVLSLTIMQLPSSQLKVNSGFQVSP